MLKLLFNIFIVYAIWQLFKMFFAVNRAQKKFHERINDLDGKVKEKAFTGKSRNDQKDGDYIDYEEIK